jgi:hypothetical protein
MWLKPLEPHGEFSHIPEYLDELEFSQESAGNHPILNIIFSPVLHVEVPTRTISA